MELISNEVTNIQVQGKSAKRKSSDNDENFDTVQLGENEDHSVAPKKVRINATENCSIPAPKATKSALPRYNNQPTTGGAGRKNPGGSLTPKAKAANANREKIPGHSANAMVQPIIRPILTEVNSPIVSHGATPRKPQIGERNLVVESTISATPRISTNPFLKKFQHDFVNEVTGTQLAKLFDATFSSLEDRLVNINNSLKTKNNKWDVKDRVKRLEAGIKDLRDIIVNLQDNVRITKDSCVSFETKLANGIRELYDHLVDDVQLVASLQSNERKMRKEIENLQNERKEEASKLALIRTESINQVRSSETKLLLKDKEIERLQEKLRDLEGQFEKLTHAHQENLVELKQSQSKHNDELVKIYQMEIAAFQVNQNKLEGEIDKLTRDYEEMQRKNMEMVEALASTKSSVKDTELNKDILEREVNRLTNEVVQLKETITKKDDDLRNSMQNVYEIQKQALEEKCTLRQEAGAMNLRMQMLEEERRNLTSQISNQKEEHSLLLRDLEQLKEVKASLEHSLHQKEMEAAAAKDSCTQLEIEKELRIRAESREETERRERIAAMGQLIAIQNECNKTVKDAEERCRQLEESSKSSLELISKARDVALQEAKENSDIALGLKEEIQQLHLALESGPTNKGSIEELSRCKGELEVLKQKLQEASVMNEKLLSNDVKRIAEYEEKLRISESQRRKLHNLVQELRGNIRVFARVRPFLPGDGYELTNLPDPAINVRPDLNSLKILKANPENNNKKEEYDFNFDKVFGQSCSQEALFSEVAEFVQSALDGYHVCLFSYGQTGSGKTHTMNGSGEGPMRGIIPRAMEQVGAYKKQLQEKGWCYHMEVSFLEIYNETIRDLLRKSDGGKEDGKHEIKKDLQGNLYVSELTKISVDPEDFQQIMSIMEMAAQHRSVSQTLMNDRSSRSHAVFTLHLKASNPSQGVELNGALNLVDLAGSERVDRSGVTGSDFKETVAINKSLSALADVFAALANKQPHIPYRNSKLTFLLQPALSGDGKTLMIVNLSPTEASFFESLSSLRFANQVSQCELGKPKRKLKDVGTDSSVSTKSLSKELANMKDNDDCISSSIVPTTTATPSKQKLTNTWEGSSINRSKLPTAETGALSASLGSKRPLESTSSKSSSLSTKSKITSMSSRSIAPPRTPGKK